MAIFKTNKDIFSGFGEESLLSSYLDSNIVQYPPTREWTNERPLEIEDIDVWEVLYETSGGTGLYIAWSPYAEFYMVKDGISIETFYGISSHKRLAELLDMRKIPYKFKEVWVDEDSVQI